MTAGDSKKNNKEQTQKEHNNTVNNNTHSPKNPLCTVTKRTGGKEDMNLG